MPIDYKVNVPISTDQFIDVLNRSTLGQRRPIDDRECMEAMVKHANLVVTAWDGGTLIGVARSMTDFVYACYLSDLAVDEAYQRQGVGKALIGRSQEELGPRCKVRLISAPAAVDFYRKIGFTPNTNCWELTGDKRPSGFPMGKSSRGSRGKHDTGA